MAGTVAMELLRGLSGAATGSLVAAVWQGALLAGVAGLGLRLLPRTPAAARFAIWFSVFVVVAALPLASLWEHAGAASAAAGRGPWLTVSVRWSEAVLALWLAISAVRAGMLALAAVRVRSLWKRATPIEIPAGGVAGEDALGRKIEICTSDEVDRPSVIGFFAPKILIPAWLVEKLTPEEMAHVVLHEAGHLRRADDWLNLLQKIALVVFPLNPALAWVERRLCLERELACDEQVLNATGAPKAYASCLTALAEHRMTRRGMALVMGALGRESDLGQRVRRILGRREQMRPAQARLLMGGALCALLAGAAGLERIPQLVGFSSGRSALAAKAPVSAGFRYQDVVYRPGPAGMAGMRAVNLVAHRLPGEPQAGAGNALGRMGDTEVQPAGPAPGVRAASARVPRPREARLLKVPSDAVGPRQSAPAVVTTEWVVMTSWSVNTAGYGARIVMTSIAAGPAQQPSLKATAPVRDGAGDAASPIQARSVPAVQPMTPVGQNSSYAAVPVRGGWLVIQL